MFDVTGKVALITGGSQGIGAAIAKEFLQAGLRGVSIMARSEETSMKVIKELTNEFGEGKAVFIKGDVSDRQQFDDAFKRTVGVFNNIDIVVNNAIARGETAWERIIAVNLTGSITGTILALENYIPKYASDNGGVIINISSSAGLHGFPPLPVYTASKSGIIGLTRALGSDFHYKRTNIKVIAVCAGYTDTPAIFTDKSDFLGKAYFDLYEDYMKNLFPQPASAVSKAVVTVIKEGCSGSIWIADNSKPPYEVQLAVKKEEEQ
ncbi:hypothetical protein RI129_006545 [Pyrocoelia pectoralis]|uniref:15-hydroxyprostaglandin dehydrogenase [NAD(+)]-like n=1 Tax=Pyrocoelia pectoralis TaxID=417401 RepID=A0AAN7ZGA0_9COLE